MNNLNYQETIGIIEILNSEAINVLQIGKGDNIDYYIIDDFISSDVSKSSFHYVSGRRINKVISHYTGILNHDQKQKLMYAINELPIVRRKYEKGENFPWMTYEAFRR